MHMSVGQMILWVLLQALVVFATAKVVPGIKVESYGAAIVVAIVYAIVSFLLKGVLVFISLPLIFLTFGLFLFVVNMLLLWVTDKLVSSLEIKGVVPLAMASLCISIGGVLVNWIVR
jgi:putative membrane protein